MIKVGIIGYGYWGVNLLRNFINTPHCIVKTLCDQRPERLALAQKSYPSVNYTTSVDELLNDSEIDAVVIATPVFLHYSLSKQALLKGKHILVEKPFTSSTAEAPFFYLHPIKFF